MELATSATSTKRRKLPPVFFFSHIFFFPKKLKLLYIQDIQRTQKSRDTIFQQDLYVLRFLWSFLQKIKQKQHVAKHSRDWKYIKIKQSKNILRNEKIEIRNNLFQIAAERNFSFLLLKVTFSTNFNVKKLRLIMYQIRSYYQGLPIQCVRKIF